MRYHALSIGICVQLYQSSVRPDHIEGVKANPYPRMRYQSAAKFENSGQVQHLPWQLLLGRSRGFLIDRRGYAIGLGSYQQGSLSPSSSEVGNRTHLLDMRQLELSQHLLSLPQVRSTIDGPKFF